MGNREWNSVTQKQNFVCHLHQHRRVKTFDSLTHTQDIELKKCLEEILEKIFFLKKNSKDDDEEEVKRKKNTEKISFKKGTKRNCESLFLFLPFSLTLRLRLLQCL